MPRHRTYANDAARQAAYRQRTAMGRKRDVTNRACRDDEFVEKLRFVRDVAGAVSRDSIKNWRGWSGAAEMHSFALQQDIDDLVSMIDALIRGDDRPFQTQEFEQWRVRREQAKLTTQSDRHAVAVSGYGARSVLEANRPDGLGKPHGYQQSWPRR